MLKCRHTRAHMHSEHKRRSKWVLTCAQECIKKAMADISIALSQVVAAGLACDLATAANKVTIAAFEPTDLCRRCARPWSLRGKQSTGAAAVMPKC